MAAEGCLQTTRVVEGVGRGAHTDSTVLLPQPSVYTSRRVLVLHCAETRSSFPRPRLEASVNRSTPALSGTLGFIALLAVVFSLGGVQLQVVLGEGGVAAAEWLLLLAPALWFIRFTGADPVRTLSLRIPRDGALVGGSLLLAGAVPLIWTVSWLQTFVLPVPLEVLAGLEELVTARTMSRFVWLLLVLAVTPAICEEIVFRGVLLASARELAPWRMLLLNGVVFGAFHLSFETVIRFLPTATLGIVIAWAVWRTGSIWVGVLMHFLNNATILVLASTPGLEGAFSDPEAPPPLWLVPCGAVAFAGGVRLLLNQSPPGGGSTNNPNEDP